MKNGKHMYLLTTDKINNMIDSGYSFGSILGYIRDLYQRSIIYYSEKNDLVNYLKKEMKARKLI